MMRGLILVAALAALAGCASQPAENADAGNDAADNAMVAPAPLKIELGGVDLTGRVEAGGTEPYWGLDVAPGEMVFTDFSAAEPKPMPFYPVAAVVAGERATYTTKNVPGDAVVLTLTVKECLDVGEPEDALPLTAELRIGSRIFRGCAGQKVFEPAEAGNSTDNASDGEIVVTTKR